MDVDKNQGSGSGSNNVTPKKVLAKVMGGSIEEDVGASCSSSDGRICGEDEDTGETDEDGDEDGEKTRRRKDTGASGSKGGRSGKNRLIPPIMDTSIILDNLDNKFGEECCICMENRPEVSLPCAHSYCLPCIEQWLETNINP